MSKRVIVYGTASEQALVQTIEELRRENAALQALLIRIRNEKDLLKTRPGVQDQYAGMPPVYRLIDAALARKEAQP